MKNSPVLEFSLPQKPKLEHINEVTGQLSHHIAYTLWNNKLTEREKYVPLSIEKLYGFTIMTRHYPED